MHHNRYKTNNMIMINSEDGNHDNDNHDDNANNDVNDHLDV